MYIVHKLMRAVDFYVADAHIAVDVGWQCGS